MLGQDLCPLLRRENEVIEADLPEVDITQINQLFCLFNQTQPELVIHLAAYTDVDGCERKKEYAYQVNALGTWNVALLCQEGDRKLVYLSTDYVFNGEKKEPYLELDHPHPLNVYGWSKLAGEEYVKMLLNKFYLIRTSWLFGKKGKNFIETILRLAQERDEIKVVDDQRGTPTWTVDLAQQMSELIKTDFYGIYHISNHGECSWFEFAREIIKKAGLGTRIIPVSSAEIGRPARRPAYSVLSNSALQMRGLDKMKNWQEVMEKYLEEE
jgi:dTDP-4-dehydrorhamnose reductase